MTIPNTKKIQLNSLTFTEGKNPAIHEIAIKVVFIVMATDDNNDDSPNHEENSIEFPNIHRRKNPACCHFVMATDDNKLKQNNQAMLGGRP